MSEPTPAAEQAVIDAAHVEHQREWSTATFGPREQRGPLGPLAHLRKELDEVADDPTDVGEWVDVIILAFDGAWRAGHEPQQIIDAVKAKQAKNEARTWPDWRGVPQDQAIEHVRLPNACKCGDCYHPAFGPNTDGEPCDWCQDCGCAKNWHLAWHPSSPPGSGSGGDPS